MNRKNEKFAMICEVARYGIEAALTASAIKRTGKLWPLTLFIIFAGAPTINIGGNHCANTSTAEAVSQPA